MEQMQIFENKQFGAIRTVKDENGEPWFVGKDVASVLGYSNTMDALSKHVDADDKQTSQIAMLGQSRKMTIINESGLYSLILSSKLPQAREFKHWVTSEVLPQIRKTGGYIPIEEDKLTERIVQPGQGDGTGSGILRQWLPDGTFLCGEREVRCSVLNEEVAQC